MRVKYVGPHAEVEIAATGDFCKAGETVKVPDEVGESLVEQDTWEKAADKATEKKEPK